MNNYCIIEGKVDRVLENLEYFKNKNSNIDTIKFANFFGFNVLELNNIEDNVDGIINVDNNIKDIVINDNISSENKRYIITYLLSYYLLYYNNEYIFKHSYISNKDIDKDASYMSRLLLVREKPFEIFYRELKRQVREEYVTLRLQRQFEVSEELIKLRINDLNKVKIKKLTNLK